ncbi:uncharacterized protein EV420DRAFT_1763049 [Desarmillaria tabescens]|uniref:Uncharacterized protein n=1 Tax=Armillaria tabescens TaxID=1929756 RepID=A0AA39N6M1_ARMTA|nr:uncharacterized protein EV420DRAFT_1763049 [Desarmillaria tabescens]KAK0460096.1 hypothetical protein EV420DRAFT_1763049 [Desarmillaria tabescens]
MSVSSVKGANTYYYFHYTSGSDVPVEANFATEEKNQRIDRQQAPSMEDIAQIMENPNYSTDYLVADARGLIKDFQNCGHAVPTWLSVLDGSLVSVLSAMLDCAPSDRGLRYVSSAICACKSDRMFNRIMQLSLVWFAHFLWPFKALNWYEDREAQSCDALREQVLLRQNHRCAISGLAKIGHEKPPWCGLRISRILHTPIIGSEKTDFFGTMTREIIKNYINPVVNLDYSGGWGP